MATNTAVAGAAVQEEAEEVEPREAEELREAEGGQEEGAARAPQTMEAV